ncbi:MAG: class I SAM-dependent methyltransferase [Pseudomonadales bacterium]|nr:class I SAM-dependent methyltransferase [Pseudomonadales bacterium]
MNSGAVRILGELPEHVRRYLPDLAIDAAEAEAEIEPFCLSMTARGLTLSAPSSLGVGSLCLSFLDGRMGWRGSRPHQELLVRACGVRTATGSQPLRILDGTGGLGGDSWLLAAAGAEVRCLEQHPVLVALIADALERARAVAPSIVARVQLQCADSAAVLDSMTADQDPAVDVVYLDPMYPARRKAALGDGRLRLIAALLAADGVSIEDGVGDRLLAAALQSPVRRIVLKRPLRAERSAVASSHRLEGRSTRFDVWLRPAPA